MFDGWSSTVFKHEFKQRRQGCVITSKPYDYADFCKRETKQLQSAKGQEAVLWWKSQVPYTFYMDLPYQSIKSSLSYCDSYSFSCKTEEILKKWSEYTVKYRMTPFMLFHVYCSILFQFITKQSKVLFGGPYLNRSSEQEEKAIGLFVKLLPYLYCINPSQTFQDTISHCIQQFKKTIQYLSVSFEQVSQHSPQVVLTNSLEESTTESFSYDVKTVSKFGLSLYFKYSASQEIYILWKYDVQKFALQQIKEMNQALLTLMQYSHDTLRIQDLWNYCSPSIGKDKQLQSVFEISI